MDRFVQSLVAVVEANQRFLLRRALIQLAFVIAAAIGLSRLEGGWWWLCLVFFVLGLLSAILGVFQLKAHLTMKLEPPWRAIGLRAPERRSKDQVLELHLLQGGVTFVPVRADLVDGLLSAAREAGLEITTDAEGLKTLDAASDRLERLHDLEALIPHVPTPELRGAISSALARVRELQPQGCDEVLRELEIKLMAEKSAQTTTSLRGPKPVFEKEIREQLAALEAADR